MSKRKGFMSQRTIFSAPRWFYRSLTGLTQTKGQLRALIREDEAFTHTVYSGTSESWLIRHWPYCRPQLKGPFNPAGLARSVALLRSARDWKGLAACWFAFVPLSLGIKWAKNLVRSIKK